MFISKFDKVYQRIIKESYGFDSEKYNREKKEAGLEAIEKIIGKLKELDDSDTLWAASDFSRCNPNDEDWIKEKCQAALIDFSNSIKNGIDGLDEDSAHAAIKSAIKHLDGIPSIIVGPVMTYLDDIFNTISNDLFLYEVCSEEETSSPFDDEA